MSPLLSFPLPVELRRVLQAGFCVLVVFAGAILWGAPSPASADSSGDLSMFEGEWRLVDPATTKANRERAIEDAIENLNWVLRQMASPQLVRSTALPSEMQFFRKGKQLRQRVHETDGLLERPVDLESGTANSQTMKGEPFEAAWSMSERGLRLNWKQHQAHGSNVYRVDPETGFLIVEHTIQITAIDDVAPIVFEGRFDRKSPPSVSARASSASEGSPAP